MVSCQCFNNESYVDQQVEAILKQKALTPQSGRLFIEFGGKAYDDKHSARVLPGYDPHIKLQLLKYLSESFEIVVVVSARDILKPRIRGDSQLFYGDETLNLVQLLRQNNIVVKFGVLSMVKNSYNDLDNERIAEFLESSKNYLGINFFPFPFIPFYHHKKIFQLGQTFFPSIPIDGKNILIISPGGGSGKFGVCLSLLMNDFLKNKNSSFIKFETYPVYNLPIDHPVNLAFIAASADLGNTLVQDEKFKTSYDKDVQNFDLLKFLVEQRCPNLAENPLSLYEVPSDMGVNRITSGFVNEELIKKAAWDEIKKRVSRYQKEIQDGIEYPQTLDHLFGQIPNIK